MPNFFKLDFSKKEKTPLADEQNEQQPKIIEIEMENSAEIQTDFISDTPEQQEQAVNSNLNIIYNISVKDIAPNPNQPRHDFDERLLYGLAQSIKDYGIIQPLSVRRISSSSANENSYPVYELVAGERRLRAAKILGLEAVPCVIFDTDTRVSAELAIIENLQREDLNFFEQAKAIEKLIEMFSYSQEQVARKLSVSQSYIANKLRILRLSTEEREIILESGLTERHARAFIRISDAEERKKVIFTVINRIMNVSMTESFIDRILLDKLSVRESKSENKQKRLMIVKDVRLFLNSIDKAVNMVTQSGINIKSEKIDKGEYIEVLLKIPKNK